MQLMFLFCFLALFGTDVEATCYFAPELQGEFITQSTVTHDSEVLYTQVNITEDSIPIWGQCYKRIDSNVILRIDSDETSCFRCFRMKLVSRNVLRVHTAEKDYISKCYTNEEKAIASCPTADILKNRNLHKEIMLYKLTEYNGEEIRREYCPINGRYRFSYRFCHFERKSCFLRLLQLIFNHSFLVLMMEWRSRSNARQEYRKWTIARLVRQ